MGGALFGVLAHWFVNEGARIIGGTRQGYHASEDSTLTALSSSWMVSLNTEVAAR